MCEEPKSRKRDFNDLVEIAMGRRGKSRIVQSDAEYALQNHLRGLDSHVKDVKELIKKATQELIKTNIEIRKTERRFRKLSGNVIR